MYTYLKTIAALGALISLPAFAGAATVTVIGSTGTPDGISTFAKLSDAVAYINANSTAPSTPNIINVTADHTDDKQIHVTVPVTINGVLSGTGTPTAIAVDRDTIKNATNIGPAGLSYMEIQAEGNVTVNDLRIFCIGVNFSSPTIDGVSLFKPASGTGNYVFNNLEIGGSASGAYVLPTVASPYSVSGARFWYGYGSTNHGTVYVSNEGGAGNYSSTFNSCDISMARTSVVYISNQSGTTTINGGIIAGAGEDCIRINGATGVTLTGTASNRLRMSAGNSSNAGQSLRLRGACVVDKIEFVDFVNQATLGDMTKVPPYGSAVLVESGTVTKMSRVRTGNIHAYGLHLMDGSVTVNDSTFYSNGKPNFNSTSQPSPNPVRIDGGTATFTDSIFASAFGGKIQLNGGTASFTNCALPTDGVTSESLATDPFTVAPANNVDSISASPAFITAAYTLTDTSNPNFLLPTNTAYAAATSYNQFLFGGAGVSPSSVNDWNLY